MSRWFARLLAVIWMGFTGQNVVFRLFGTSNPSFRGFFLVEVALCNRRWGMACLAYLGSVHRAISRLEHGLGEEPYFEFLQ